MVFRATYQQLMTEVIINPHDTEGASGGDIIDHVSYAWNMGRLTYVIL